jgi:small subunit ribosomal protein S6
VNNWGRRKLAYEIDHRADGFYYVMQFTVGERTLNELKRILRVSDDILRHIIVKLPPRTLTSRCPRSRSRLRPKEAY